MCDDIASAFGSIDSLAQRSAAAALAPLAVRVD